MSVLKSIAAQKLSTTADEVPSFGVRLRPCGDLCFRDVALLLAGTFDDSQRWCRGRLMSQVAPRSRDHLESRINAGF